MMPRAVLSEIVLCLKEFLNDLNPENSWESLRVSHFFVLKIFDHNNSFVRGVRRKIIAEYCAAESVGCSLDYDHCRSKKLMARRRRCAWRRTRTRCSGRRHLRTTVLGVLVKGMARKA